MLQRELLKIYIKSKLIGNKNRMYSNANKEENLEFLMNLVDNESKIILDETILKSNWLAKPDTLGDVVILQILSMITKKIKGFNLDEKEIQNANNKDLIQQKIETFLKQIQSTDLINRMIELLESPSNTKKDVAILILCILSGCKPFINLMLNKEFLQSLISHVNSFKKSKISKLQRAYHSNTPIIKKIICKPTFSTESFLGNEWIKFNL